MPRPNGDAGTASASLDREVEQLCRGIEYALLLAEFDPDSEEARSYRRNHPTWMEDLKLLRDVAAEVKSGDWTRTGKKPATGMAGSDR